MKQFGLIGYPLSHSFSAKYFTEKFQNEGIVNCKYENFEIESIGEFPSLISKIKPMGLNVTIPYKEQVIPYLTSLENIAKEVGAVNTIKLNNDQLIGYNTDVYGFKKSLAPFLESHHQKALILGTGGASKAVTFALKSLGLDVFHVSRNPAKEKELSYHQINKEVINSFLLIVNTTPLGTYPNTNTCPTLPFEFISNKHLLYDLVYNPALTKFLAMGKKHGANIINGETMLKLQAEKAWEIWNSH